MSKSDLNALNRSIDWKNPITEQKPLNTLLIDKPYEIPSMCTVTTLTEDVKNGTLFKCWLPKRLSETMIVELIKKINESNIKYSFTYLGHQSVASSNHITIEIWYFGVGCS